MCSGIRALCRSERVTIVRGPRNLLSIPKGSTTRPSICTLVEQGCPRTANPLVIRQLSVTADKILLVTGARFTCRHLRRTFLGRRVRGGCITVVSKGRVPRGKVVSLPLLPSCLGHPHRVIGRRRNGRTVARCRVLRHVSNSRLHVTLCPGANEARRLHIRYTRRRNLGTPVLNSPLCNGRGTTQLRLRTRRVAFRRPLANGGVAVGEGTSFWVGPTFSICFCSDFSDWTLRAGGVVVA